MAELNIYTNFATIHNIITNKIVDTDITEESVELEYADIFGNNLEKKIVLDIK